MEINFFNPNNTKTERFGDVRTHQFFVSLQGCLFQKYSPRAATMIAGRNGQPFSEQRVFCENDAIERILPEVTKINF